MAASEQPTADELMRRIAATGKTSFSHILFFNSLRTTGTATDGINTFTDIHSNLMSLHGFMAGFQYVALESGEEGGDLGTLEKYIFTLRVLGFGMSLLGTLVSLITIEFLKSITAEEPEFQVEGALRYNEFFLWSDRLAVLAAINLAVTVNLVVHTKDLSDALSYSINGLSVALVALFLFQFKRMILDRQTVGPGRQYYDYLSHHFKDT